jgi:WD40 repeat protein
MLPITSARFSPDGSLLAVTVADALLRLFYVGNGRLLNTYGGQRGRLNKARFDSEGVWLLTASDDGTAGVFKVDDRSEYLRLHGHSGRVLDADFSPDGRFVVTAGSDGMALVHPLSPEALFRHACCVLRSYRDFTPLPVADDDFQNANQFCRPEWQRADCAEQR